MDSKFPFYKPSKKVFDKLLAVEWSFAFYRLPLEKNVQLIHQTNNSFHEFDEKKHTNQSGFLFAPFQTTKDVKPIFISHTNETGKVIRGRITISRQGKRQDYVNLLAKIQKAIARDGFKKIVAARTENVVKPKTFHAYTFFLQLCKSYPNAFVSMVYTPAYGLWIGATPEVLLKVWDSKVSTYALAGTQAFRGKMDVEWQEKESEEHRLVEDYISKVFKIYQQNEPLNRIRETIRAGNLVHLRTVMDYKMPQGKSWSEVARRLHPTPAVGGLPKKNSIQFILRNELNPRTFYSGYLGPVNVNNQINLFVNLRCLQVFESQLSIYVGGGITGKSQVQKEWKETVMKADTLKQVLTKSG